MGEDSDEPSKKSLGEVLGDEISKIINEAGREYYKKRYQGPYGEKIKIKP